MVRTKIEVNISALGLQAKVLNVTIGSSGTCKDVISKVLQKLDIQESPTTKYQLSVIAKNDAGSQGSK